MPPSHALRLGTIASPQVGSARAPLDKNLPGVADEQLRVGHSDSMIWAADTPGRFASSGPSALLLPAQRLGKRALETLSQEYQAGQHSQFIKRAFFQDHYERPGDAKKRQNAEHKLLGTDALRRTAVRLALDPLMWRYGAHFSSPATELLVSWGVSRGPAQRLAWLLEDVGWSLLQDHAAHLASQVPGLGALSHLRPNGTKYRMLFAFDSRSMGLSQDVRFQSYWGSDASAFFQFTWRF